METGSSRVTSPQVEKAKAPVLVQQPALQLADVTPDSLCFFNFVTNAWRGRVTLEEAIQVDYSSNWVVLADGSIFCCGGVDGQTVEPIRCVYLLSGSGSVQRRADMSVPRCNHGVVAMEQGVYVFGGCKLQTVCTPTRMGKYCEKFEVQNNRWTRLPDMKYGRTFFNPCVFQGLIYLSGRTYIPVLNATNQ